MCALPRALLPKYTPELMQQEALGTPLQCLLTAGRGVEILWAAGVFAGGLLYDRFQRAEDVESRSNQLRVMLAELGWGPPCHLHCPPCHRHAFSALVSWVIWYPVTRRAISAWLIARHVIDTHFAPSFLRLHGIR